MILSETITEYLKLHFTDAEKTRLKDKAVNEWDSFKNSMKGQTNFSALQTLEELEKKKDIAGKDWRTSGDRMVDLEGRISEAMGASNLTVITVPYDNRLFTVTALPNLKLEVRST